MPRSGSQDQKLQTFIYGQPRTERSSQPAQRTRQLALIPGRDRCFRLVKLLSSRAEINKFREGYIFPSLSLPRKHKGSVEEMSLYCVSLHGSCFGKVKGALDWNG